MEYAYQNSTIAQILEAIINESTFEGESNSNIGDILLSILNKTPYTEPPKSVIADLLLRVKAKIEGESFDPYEGDHISRIADILLSILNETEYTEAPQSRIAELLLELKEELEAYTELTASGSIASFITNCVKPLVNGEFTIAAYQEGSGDPSPVNVRNIVPFNTLKITKAGKNLFDKTKYQKRKYIDENTGEIINISNDSAGITDYIPVKAGEVIYIPSKGTTRNSLFDRNKNLIRYFPAQNRSVTIPNDGYIVCGGYNLNVDTFQLEVGETATDYEPYNGETVTVQLGQDVYGGSYNSVTGVKNDNKVKIVINGTETLRIANQNYIKEDACDCYYDNNNIYPLIPFSNQPQTLCNKLKFSNEAIWSSRGYPNTFTINNRQIHLNIANDLLGITDYTQETPTTALAKIKAFLETNNIEILIPVAETETQLDPTLIETFDGANNIFCDTGDTSVTYLYKGTPPETVTRLLSKGSSENNDIMKEEIEEIKTEDEKPINEEVNENEK